MFVISVSYNISCVFQYIGGYKNLYINSDTVFHAAGSSNLQGDLIKTGWKWEKFVDDRMIGSDEKIGVGDDRKAGVSGWKGRIHKKITNVSATTCHDVGTLKRFRFSC